MSKLRYHTLDSLRGLACLQVIVSHCLVAIPALSWLVYQNHSDVKHNFLFNLVHSPLSFFWSDSAAVKVFFVLSGFVLSLPFFLESGKTPYYPQYFAKRIIRLYLPCLAVILISMFLKQLLYAEKSIGDFGDWVKIMWSAKLNLRQYIDLFFLKDNLNYFDRALWTLPVEIKLSLLIPAVVYISKRLNKLGNVLFLCLYISAWHILNWRGARNFWWDFPTLYYFSFFIIGVILCNYREPLIAWINKLSNVSYYFILVLAIILYTFAHSMWWLPNRIYSLLVSRTDYISAVSAILIVAFVLSERARLFLSAKFLVFLGKVSFSIYLIHIIVITSLGHLLGAYLRVEIIVAIAFLISFPLSFVFYTYIEVTSLKFANKCANYFRPSGIEFKQT